MHLTVDTAMETGSLNISAYVARKLHLGERLLARKFQEVECEIDTQEIENVGGGLQPRVHKRTIHKMEVCCRCRPALPAGAHQLQQETGTCHPTRTAQYLARREGRETYTSICKVVLCSAVDVLKKDGAAPLPRDLDGLQKTLDRLQECLARAHAYGEEVVVCAFLIRL